MQCGRNWILAILLVGAAAIPLRAADQQSPPAEATPTLDLEKSLPAQQVGDAPVEPFEPLALPAADVEAQRAARAWYMTGKVHEARGEGDDDELQLALDAYRRAVELDPHSLRTYEALIPVLYARGQKADARKYALQAARQNEQGLRIVRGLAAVIASGENLQDAAALLREAAAAEGFSTDHAAGLLVHRDLGRYLHMSEQPVEAAQSYRFVFDAVQTDRQPPLSDDERKELLGAEPGRIYDEFGKTFLEAKLPDLAVKAFDQAATFRAGSPGVHSFNLALVFRETGRSEEALAELEKYFAAQLQSKGRDAYQLLKDLLSDLERGDELLPKLEGLYQDDERNSSLAFFLADEYAATGSLDQARTLFEKTLGSTSDPRGLIGLLTVYRQQRQSRELVQVLGKIFPQIPDDRSPENLQKLPPDAREIVTRYDSEFNALSADGEALDGLMQVGRELETADPPINLAEAYMLGKLAIAAKRTEDAQHFYRLTMSMLNQPMLNVYRELGEFLIEQKLYADAVQVFREAAENPAFEPARWILLYFMTYPLEFDGKTDEALTAITEARGSQPENPLLHFQQAWINYHAERWDAAEPLLKEIIDEYKGDAENQDTVRKSQFSLSNLYVQRGELELGEKILEDVLKEAPDDSQANNDLGYLWADKNKNLDQARTMIEKALQEEPDNPAYLDSMGWVLFRLGEFAEARTHLEKAVAQPTGDDSTIFDHLGDVLDKLELKTEAQAAWRKAAELERAKARPDDELLERVEAKLPAADPAAETTPADDASPPAP